MAIGIAEPTTERNTEILSTRLLKEEFRVGMKKDPLPLIAIVESCICPAPITTSTIGRVGACINCNTQSCLTCISP